MPIKPEIRTLTNSSVDVLNAIRNSATTNYQNYVPIATPNADSVRQIGAVLMDFPALQNEFLHALINRIGRVIVSSKMYSNPWSVFKKGYLEFGETVEEIFVNIAKPFTYSPDTAAAKYMAREIPDVRSAFHPMNYQKFYKATVQQDDLRKAFLSWAGVNELISRIIGSMYTGAAYDEFLVMKYLLARRILNGQIKPVTVLTISRQTAEDNISTIKGVSNDMEFMSPEYNMAGVPSPCEKGDQYLIMSSKFDAIADVSVLAMAFNMNKADFAGHKILVDSFGKLDTTRLAELFAGDPTYEEISSDELAALDAIPAVLVSREFFQIFDNLERVADDYNGEGLYMQYWLHVWKTFSTSPFANAALFVPGTPTVSGVTISPSAVSASAGQSVSFSANVATEYFAPQAVVWSSSSEDVVINAAGIATISTTAKKGAATITATSIFNPEKSATATLTIA